MRTAEIKRKTAETDIYLYIDLDGTGKNDIATGCGFLDHMLTLFSAHSKFDLTVKCKGTFLGYSLKIPTEKVGDFDTELVEEFWYGFVRKAECALHLKQLAGTNSHHIIEGAFKSAARSLRKATDIDLRFAGEIPSTKGVL